MGLQLQYNPRFPFSHRLKNQLVSGQATPNNYAVSWPESFMCEQSKSDPQPSIIQRYDMK